MSSRLIVPTSGLLAFGVGATLRNPVLAAEFLSADEQVKVGQIITDENKASPWTGGFALARDAIVPPEVKLKALPQGAQQTAPQLRGFSYLRLRVAL